MNAKSIASSGFGQYTNSETVVAALQRQYGTMQPGKLQAQRKQFWSYVTFPVAGTSQLNFFGQALGNAGLTLEDTNMPVQGSFGTSSFILKGVELKYKLPALNYAAFAGTDATTITSEILGGLFQAGIFELVINAKTYLQIPKPFMQMPPADGRVSAYVAGQTDANTGVEPKVTLSSRSENKYILDPEVFIAAQQNFSCSINYPSGAMSPRATSIIAAGNALRVGVVFDGIEIRPVQ